jgi:hypothetical protein
MSLTLTIRIIFGCCPIPQTTPSHAQVAADELEVRLYALGVIYWHKDRLSNVAEWAGEVLSTENRCLPASNPAAEPLIAGLKRAHEAMDAAILARGMPQDLGIDPSHIAKYVTRFSNARGMPGVKEDWDIGKGWTKAKPPPRVLCAARSVALYLKQHRQPLSSLMFPVGMDNALSPPLRGGGSAIRSPRKRLAADALTDAAAAELRASTAETNGRRTKSRLSRAIVAKKCAVRQQQLAENEKDKLAVIASLWEARARASERLVGERNAEVVAAHDTNSVAAVSLASCTLDAQAAIDSAFESTLASPAIPDKTRLFLMQLLALRTPPSCAAASFPAMAHLLGASIDVPALSVQSVKNIREEMPAISELLAALYVARQNESGAKGTWIMDATSIDQLPIVTSVFEIGGLQTALGFRVPESGTALGELQACAGLTEDGRSGIQELRAILERSEHTGAAAALLTLPAASSFSFLAADSCVMDQCPQAQLMQKLFDQYVGAGPTGPVAAKIEAAGAGAAQSGNIVNAPCNNHLGATVDRAGCAALDTALKEKLSGKAGAFAEAARVLSGGIKGHLRAVYKELDALWYAKGHSSDFKRYLETDAKGLLYLRAPRPMTARFFWVLRAGCRGYFNRPVQYAFLEGLAPLAEKGSILTDRCRSEGTVELVGAKRAIAIIYFKFGRDETFLTAGKVIGWGQGKMAFLNVLKMAAYQKISANPDVALNPSFDPYAAIAAEEPLLREFREKCEMKKQPSADGTSFCIDEEITRRLYHPTDPTDAASTDCCRDFLRAWSIAAVEKMLSTPVAQFLPGGRYSAEEQAKNADMKKKLAGLVLTSDAGESSFSIVKNITNNFPGINIGTASGIAVAIMNGDFDAGGRSNFVNEHPAVQAALLEYGRRQRAPRKAATREEITAHAEHKESKRELIRAKLKKRAILRCVRALKLHAVDIPSTAAKVRIALGQLDSESAKYKLLKEILMVMNVGWGITAAKTAWTRDGACVSAAELEDVLRPLLGKVKKPAHAPCSSKLAVRAVADLGTQTPQKAALLAQLEEEVTAEELELVIGAAKEKRTVEKDEYQRCQPDEAPHPAVGMDIERMTSLGSGSKMWASCSIVSITGGTSTTGTCRVQVQHSYADGEVGLSWVTLKAADFSCKSSAPAFTERLGAWRLDLDAAEEEEEDIENLAGGRDPDDDVSNDVDHVDLVALDSESEDDDDDEDG